MRRRRIAVTGLVAVAAALSTWAAIPAANAVSVTSATATRAGTAQAAPVVPGKAVPGSVHGFVPPAQHVAYPDGVAPAATPAFDNVYDVSCVHAGDCLAVGSNVTANGGRGSLLGFLWNGRSWRATTVPLPSGGTGGELTGVSCQAGGCVAVGWYYHGTHNYGLAEYWTGNGWKASPETALPSGAADFVYTWVSCTSQADCVAAGTYAPAANTAENVAVAEVWNGHSWRASKVGALPKTPYVDSGFSGISCPATSLCLLSGIYATSDNGYYHSLVERFDGAHWALVTDASPTPQQGDVDYLNGVSCASSSYCVAVGEEGPAGATTTYHGFAEVLSSSGWSLTSVPLQAGAPSTLASVSCVSATDCIAVGGLGAYYYYTTGKSAYALWNGSAWQVHYLYPPSGSGSILFGLGCAGPSYCIAVGDEGPYNKPSAHGLSAFWNGATWSQLSI